MAKQLKGEGISQDTLIEYLDTKSDFQFELKILKMMKDHGLPCEHGGHYVDPVTKLSREFDIRCRVAAGRYRLQLAVECKNLQRNFPLLVSAVQRSENECYHDAAIITHPTLWVKWGAARSNYMNVQRARFMRVGGASSHYRVGGTVGKTTAQVGISTSKEIVSGDSGIYEKWGQCLSSLDELVAEMDDMPLLPSDHWLAAVALPILVVPDGVLWRTVYDEGGTRSEDPKPVNRVSIYAGKDYSLGPLHLGHLTVSHVEIMTESGLDQFIRENLTSATALAQTFFEDVNPESYMNQQPAG